MPGPVGRSTGERPAGRGPSSVLGVVLVVAITLIGVTGVLLFGTASLDDARSRSEIDAAEHAMTQLDSRFSLVALGAAEHHGSTVPLRSGASMRVDGDSGHMDVRVVNRTTGAVEAAVLNASLGAVVYENDGTEIAYQGGGVWKRTPEGGATMVSPPEFHYRTRSGDDPTLTLPLVVVRGNGSIAGEASVTKEATEERFPITGDPDSTNPLASGQINVTVRSDYYRAWGAFFEERTGGTVTYDHEDGEVTVVLVVEQSAAGVSGGVVTGAANGLDIGNQALIDSYNSSVGDHASNPTGNTSVVSAGDVNLDQSAEIEGNLVTGGTLYFTGNGQRVHGNLTYGGSPPSDPSKIDGTISPGADVSIPRSVGWLVDQRGAELDDGSNDNGAVPGVVSGTTLAHCDPACTLPAGEYYLDSIDLGGSEELELDTSGGDVEIYVDGDVVVDQGELNVTGGGRARIYVDRDFDQKKGSVDVPGDRSPGLWFYMRPGSSAAFQDARFVGVVYGPGSGALSGTTIRFHGSGTHVYGGLVGQISDSGSEVIGQSDRVHFDEALTEEDPLSGHAGGQPTVTYMHVTVNRVNVSSR